LIRDYFTGPEAAAFFCVSDTTLWRWIKLGHIASIPLGKNRRGILKAEAERFDLEGKRQREYEHRCKNMRPGWNRNKAKMPHDFN
jgi:hypothetical protein